MINEVPIPREGDLHSTVSIGPHCFELRYGYCDERDRSSGEPYILYPDLKTRPLYAEDGCRIVAALQSVCEHYAPPDGQEREDCCYTCGFYPDPHAEIGVCRCEKMQRSPDPTNKEGGVR